MGWGRVIGSGCAGMLCLIPMAWISFSFLDLTSSVTGGLINNLNDAITSLGTLLFPVLGPILSFVASAFLGLFMILLFPIHWCIFYKPNDVMLLIAVVLPWILCCTITSAIFAHSPRGGIHTSLAIGIGYLIPAMVIYLAISLIPGGYGSLIGGVVDGAVSGLTDLPYLLAVFTAILEGCLVGAVFGGFIGSLKYKGTGQSKVKKSKSKAEEGEEPSLDSSELCPNCNAKLIPGNEFCTNCGSAIKAK